MKLVRYGRPSAVCGPDDPIVRPRGSVKLDYEVELGVVIGRDARYVGEAEALRYVAGYCLINDVSEREFQMEHGGTTTKGKSADTFGPTGPWLVTFDEAGDPQALALWTTVNDERRQDGNTAKMIFSVASLVAYVSRFMSLRPGDVISTGTPAASIRPVPGWLATIEDEATVGLGVLHARPLAVAKRPGAEQGVDPLARAHLRDVGVERRALERQRVADVDPGVGRDRAADEHFFHLVRLEALGQQLLEDDAGLRGRKDGVERRAGDRTMIRMIEILVAVPAHRRVAGHHHVGPAAADHACQVAPEPEGRLDDAVLIPEEHEVLDAEDLRGVPRFALPHGHEARVVGGVLVGAGAA